ncbi:unnamed protein product [Paramecium pentaurelia]|uniref:Uncharacterized protein n=1 Tax=Paramecium pentaurelia TaxID=43138 RepID=A0A8S1YI37_9CILI|nr:unnamed protein product [Paramecium pentaurelia]
MEYFIETEYIGGGVYDKNGQKDGYWVDLSDGFLDVNSFSEENITMVQSVGFGILLFGILGDSNLIICNYNL